MKSKANIKSHPLHPILVVFPIAFFTGTFLFDTLGLVSGRESFMLTGKYLNVAGIISAAIAAVPGVIDYFFTVPPDSSGSKRAVKHGLINTTVLLIFIFALLLRPSGGPIPAIVPGLELIGIVLLCIAGWMGGTLVHRNQIGVDIRYADAGKWKEEHFTDTDGSGKISTGADLKTNQMKLLHVGKKRIVVGKTEDGYAAFDDYCTHRGGSLASGALICGTVQCPWHGSQFDVKSGDIKAGPTKEKIRVYQVLEVGDRIDIVL